MIFPSVPNWRRVLCLGIPWLCRIICHVGSLRVELTTDRTEFICCDNDRPEAKGLLVMQMEWDGNTAKVHQKRVEVKEALEKARETVESAEWR